MLLLAHDWHIGCMRGFEQMTNKGVIVGELVWHTPYIHKENVMARSLSRAPLWFHEDPSLLQHIEYDS